MAIIIKIQTRTASRLLFLRSILLYAELKKTLRTSPFFYECSRLRNLDIHESRLLQMQGTGHEAVVLHCECSVTKQMQ